MSANDNGQGRGRPIWLFPAVSAVVALVGGFALLALTDAGGGDGPQVSTSASGAPVRVSGRADVGGPFELVKHTGETVTEQDFRGRPMLIYFGFTYCPDVCPTALMRMDASLSRMPATVPQIQPVLLSVDPYFFLAHFDVEAILFFFFFFSSRRRHTR